MKKIAFHSYFGGKNQMGVTFISPYITNNIKTYVEPFSGSMGIYFQSDFDEDTKIVYNDFNKDQANLFYCSKNYDKFLEKIKYHLENENGVLYCPKNKDIKEHFKELYYNTKKSNFSTLNFEIGDFDRATMYVFLLTSAFNSCHYMAAGFSGFNKDRMKLLTFLNKLNSEYIRYKLDKITNVENLDFEELIKKYDSPDTYFYLDPPYAQDDGIKDKGNKRLEWYGVSEESSFGPSSHKRLADLLKTLKGKWSMSYYDFPELQEWFPKDKYKWVSKDFFRSSASFSDNKDTKGTELLIMNYEMSDDEYQENYKKYNSKQTETKIKKEKVAKKKEKSYTIAEIKSALERIDSDEDMISRIITSIELTEEVKPVKKEAVKMIPKEQIDKALEEAKNATFFSMDEQVKAGDEVGVGNKQPLFDDTGDFIEDEPKVILKESKIEEALAPKKVEVKTEESDDFWN